MDATYQDYVDDVCGFLGECRADANELLDDAKTVLSLWRAAAHGWNHGTPAAQVVAEWCNGTAKSKSKSDIPATVLAAREARRRLWECKC